MNPFVLLAATAAKAGILETFLSGFQHLIGMFVVMITLAVLWGVCAFTAWLVKTFTPEPVAEALAPAPPADIEPHPAPAAATDTRIPPELVAVIAAAVETAVGKGTRVVSIKADDSNWERAGRQAVLGSHRIR